MEDNRGMDRKLYETERRMLLESIADCRAGKFHGKIGGVDKNTVYLDSARAALATMRRQRYAKKGSRLYRHRNR